MSEKDKMINKDKADRAQESSMQNDASLADSGKKSAQKRGKKAPGMRRAWFNALLRRRAAVAVLLVIQIAFLAWLLVTRSRSSVYVNVALQLLSIICVFVVVLRRSKGAFKLSWVILILSFPMFGGLLYLLSTFESSTRLYRKRLKRTDKELVRPALDGCGCYDTAAVALPSYTASIRYLDGYAGFPIWDGTDTEYLSPGEDYHACLLRELERAERYIFMEYFIVEEGVMWDPILDILKRKAAEGVEVRMMYDDIGCFFLLPKDYRAKLESFGIKCRVFNPFTPFLTVLQNNRDHRKICVIDGKVAFTGGINLADEYINAKSRFGHWKDAGIVMRGDAAWSFAVMFLQMWRMSAVRDEPVEDYQKYKATPDPFERREARGYVQPYADSPMDYDNVGEHVYMQMITGARRYLYINTPYLIIDDSMVSTLTLAAKSGVDVRIVTPHQWDKRFVHMTTRSYYRDLIRGGVRVYEYTPGFIHSKTFVADDEVATVGTTNLDFRSLYLHFECGVWMCRTPAVAQIKEDFLRTLDLCEEMTEESCRGSLFDRAMQPLLRLFAPLM